MAKRPGNEDLNSSHNIGWICEDITDRQTNNYNDMLSTAKILFCTFALVAPLGGRLVRADEQLGALRHGGDGRLKCPKGEFKWEMTVEYGDDAANTELTRTFLYEVRGSGFLVATTTDPIEWAGTTQVYEGCLVNKDACLTWMIGDDTTEGINKVEIKVDGKKELSLKGNFGVFKSGSIGMCSGICDPTDEPVGLWMVWQYRSRTGVLAGEIQVATLSSPSAGWSEDLTLNGDFVARIAWACSTSCRQFTINSGPNALGAEIEGVFVYNYFGYSFANGEDSTSLYYCPQDYDTSFGLTSGSGSSSDDSEPLEFGATEAVP